MRDDVLTLLQKYDVPTPRYTSYPTVPYWQWQNFSETEYLKRLVDTFTTENNELSIYIHLPFCEELCTYCACNKRITKNHRVEKPYLDAVIAEWRMYLNILPQKPVIREIHLGGGTPTFFSAENLSALINEITQNAIIPENHEFSVEVHPNYTTRQQLDALHQAGFNRISLGVQDFDPKVQHVINRIQTFEKTAEVVAWARELNYQSVNIDLIYGLPKQTINSIEHTIAAMHKLAPDRIAFYSYAHVPWKSKVQRRYSDDDLPKASEKWQMYHLGNELLAKMGYTSIGMDHFALPNDKLVKAYTNNELHRNFMGYTTTTNKLIIGLGASSISDTWNGFVQNEKEVEAYQEKVMQGKYPFINGHLLSQEDVIIRQHILDLMCQGKTVLEQSVLGVEFLTRMHKELQPLIQDGLVTELNGHIQLTTLGKLFVRNISATLDTYLINKNSNTTVFSKAI
jgi:oxygen-independent coproporphyrinogen III oxidase